MSLITYSEACLILKACQRKLQIYHLNLKSLLLTYFEVSSLSYLVYTRCSSITHHVLERLDDADDVNTINLEVAILQAPTTIQVTLMAPKSDSDIFTLVSFTINVPDMIPTSPTVTMQKPTSLDIDADNQLTWNSEIFDQQKMSSIIQKTYSIPLLARWLWQKMKASSGPYVVSNSAKKSFARSNSYFDKSDKSNKRLRSNLGPSASQPGANGMDID